MHRILTATYITFVASMESAIDQVAKKSNLLLLEINNYTFLMAEKQFSVMRTEPSLAQSYVLKVLEIQKSNIEGAGLGLKFVQTCANFLLSVGHSNPLTSYKLSTLNIDGTLIFRALT